MKLEFDPQTGLKIPQTYEIRERIVQKMQNAFYVPGVARLNCDPTTPAGQLVDFIVSEIQSANSAVAYLVSQLSPETAEGVFQDFYASFYILKRKVAIPTTVDCRLTGIPGTVIPFGVQAKSASGKTLLNTREVMINEQGFVYSTFRVSEYGAVIIPAHSVTQIVTVVAGWDSIDNATAGTVGRLEESRSELESRRVNSVQKNAHGSAESVESTVRSIPEVIDCVVLNNETNAPKTLSGVSVEGHSIATCVYGGKDEDIAKAIYNKKGAGCGTSGTSTVKFNDGQFDREYRIIRPTPTPVKIKVTLRGKTGIDIQASIKKSIIEDFNGVGASGYERVRLGSEVTAIRFVSPVLSAFPTATILNVEIGLKSAGYANSVSIRADQLPTLDATDIEIAQGA